ncbi:unnamed protein product [Polarella glacialis]|uniref:V-ATPase proteolipid subunit C-like domain-containing protein n=1 Tax=Polarella glacialis TaxID=89957 RepID=A0A813LQ55_POLGL|nr:unnamed protein product [Polarella glacialis]
MAMYSASTLMEMQKCDPSSAFFGFMGVTSAIVFANMGAAYGTAKSGVGISSMGVMRPDMVMRSIIPVVMAGVLGIYGLIRATLALRPGPNLERRMTTNKRLDFLQDLNTYVYAMDSQTIFHLMGDWNDEPNESPLAAALESAGGRVQSTGAPTRWEGKRCIDYAITNAEKDLANLREESAAYSDHKLSAWAAQFEENRESDGAWPEVQQDVKLATNREQLGENFRQLCDQLEAAFKIAFANCSEDGKVPRGSRAKGSGPAFERIPEASAKADLLDECFETRVWRNNLGRLKELARLEADEDQTAAKSSARQVLADKFRRAKKVDLARPRPYEGPPIHNIFDEEGESATQDIGEVLKVLVTHWRKVWRRSGPDLGNLHQLLEKVLGPKRKQQKWAHVSATELAKEAKKKAGAAASVDGWSGDEVVSFSIEMWEASAAMFRDCERLGLAPEDLANARQAHIPKEGKDVRETDGALHAAAMRPITVLSALWRVWGRARLRNSDTAEWLESWLQPEICGGRRNVDALSSVIQLLEAACDDKFIATFDYSLAFDFASPKLAAEIFEWLGTPIGTANLLLSVWESQRRVLQYAGEANTNPEEVKSTLPQGDPWAWASTTASDCMNFGRKWKDWSSRLGLKENEAKEKYYHQNYALALDEFAKVGAPPKTISGAPALLGVELAPEAGRPFTDKENKKLDRAALMARKARSLPLPAFRRLRMAASKAVPKAAYGWLCEAPTEQIFAKVEDAIARAGPNPAMGDRDLKMLFHGHSASPYFMAGQQVLMAAWRRAKRSKALPGTWREVGWVITLRTFLQKIGCLEVAAWRWTTRLGGIIDLDPSSGDFDQTNGAVGHNTREAWRLTHFERWLARSDARIASRQCQAIIYNEQRCTLTRKLVANDSHRFAVVTGASVSPQKFEVMLSRKDRRNGREPNTILCPWCKEARGADWEHMVWKCNAGGKPPELATPTDLLQRRLGWASTARAHSYNFAVTSWTGWLRSARGSWKRGCLAVFWQECIGWRRPKSCPDFVVTDIYKQTGARRFFTRPNAVRSYPEWLFQEDGSLTARPKNPTPEVNSWVTDGWTKEKLTFLGTVRFEWLTWVQTGKVCVGAHPKLWYAAGKLMKPIGKYEHLKPSWAFASWSRSLSTFPLYGLIAAVIINGKMDAATYSAYSGYAHLGAGLTVGMSSLAAGLAIGIVGDAGVRANAQQPRLFVGMILILIFAEALGLYGLTAEGKGKGLCSPYNV